MSEARLMFRVDPRLVHATLMNAWVPAHEAQQLVIADAKVAADARRRNIVEIAAIDVDRVLIVAESEVAQTLETTELHTIVLFSTLASAERAVRGGLKIAVLNVGHVPAGPGRKEYLPSVFLGPEERATIERIQALGVRVELQALPDDEPVRMEPPAALSDGADSTHAEGEFEVVNERGLHLRAAHALAAACNKLQNEVEIGHDGFMVNAKSLLGLTALGAAVGTRLKVVVTGPGAVAALARLERLFANGFDEGVAPGRGEGE